MKNKSQLFPDDYFEFRDLNDKRRLQSFKLEVEWLKKSIPELRGNICDVGCSTGEMKAALKWKGNYFGMEINKNAVIKAKQRGISFECNILNKRNFFDLIIFRGTIQHIDNPFQYLSNAFHSLRDDGYMAILATPNTDSLYYKIFNDLPALDKEKSFYIPSFDHLNKLCMREGFHLVSKMSPYIKSGYENPILDFTKFFCRVLTRKKVFSGPFPGNMMNLLFKKAETK